MAKVINQLEERICPECGKAFIFRDYWAYKVKKGQHVVNYCSWICMRKNERGEKNESIKSRDKNV